MFPKKLLKESAKIIFVALSLFIVLAATASVLLVPNQVQAAITFDNSAFLGNDSTNASTTTAPYTTTGPNSLTTVEIANFQTAAATCPSAITYNGVSMTMTESAGTQINNTGFVCIWYVLSQTGSHPFVISKVAADNVYIKVQSYDNVCAFDAHAAQATNGTSATAPLVTGADNSWIIATGGSQNNGVFDSISANISLRVSNFQANSYDSHGPITPAGAANVTGNDSTNGGAKIGIVAASFSPCVTVTVAPVFSYSFWW